MAGLMLLGVPLVGAGVAAPVLLLSMRAIGLPLTARALVDLSLVAGGAVCIAWFVCFLLVGKKKERRRKKEEERKKKKERRS